MIRELLTPGLNLEFHLYFNSENDELESISVKRARKSFSYGSSVIWASENLDEIDVPLEHKIKTVRIP